MTKLLPFRRRRPKTSPEPLSDEALVAACGVGDSAALGQLFDRHHEAVFRFVVRLARGDASQAEDLVQTTFLEAFEHAGRFRGSSAVKTWLLGIALNTWRAQVRSSKRRRLKHEAFADHHERHVSSAPVATLENRDLLARLAPAVAQLPEPLHLAFTLCDVEDVPGVEAARILGVRPGTLYRRLHEARKALREALAVHGGVS